MEKKKTKVSKNWQKDLVLHPIWKLKIVKLCAKTQFGDFSPKIAQFFIWETDPFKFEKGYFLNIWGL